MARRCSRTAQMVTALVAVRVAVRVWHVQVMPLEDCLETADIFITTTGNKVR
jgi:hypothetical protein